MQVNQVKAQLRAGQAVAGPIISETRTVGPVKLMALAGFDFLFLDMEHAMFSYDTIGSLTQMALTCGICPLVRPTDTTYAHVARALDSGAQGVIIPRVDSRAQAEAAVSFAKYPPLGRRGAGGDGRNGYERRSALEAVEESNAETLIVLQIESTDGLANAAEIAATPGVDVLLIGPQDLSIALGVHGNFGHPTFIEAAQKVVDAGKQHGVATGMVEKDPADFERWHAMGMRFLVCSSDSNYLREGAARDVKTLQTFTKAG
jgi:2-dehydro-3-deoxyglucarate aldolase/4-hydroxy-2-oxoheptanedioate aldolase